MATPVSRGRAYTWHISRQFLRKAPITGFFVDNKVTRVDAVSLYESLSIPDEGFVHLHARVVMLIDVFWKVSKHGIFNSTLGISQSLILTRGK